MDGWKIVPDHSPHASDIMGEVHQWGARIGISILIRRISVMKTRTVSIAWISLPLLLMPVGCSPAQPPTAQPPTAQPSITPMETPTDTGPLVRIHFLGHAAFILQFDNGLSVLSDYGDASRTGWGVEVFGFGDFQPDIVTYSQTHHPDHYLEMEFKGARILTGDASLSKAGLVITPVPTHELTMDSFDSYGFLFAYKGSKILIAGEPLQYILNSGEEQVKQEIRAKYADSYDLVIIPISGLRITYPQVESFIRLLNTRRVILMHAMDVSFYPAFLSFLEKEHPGRYQLENVNSPGYDLEPADRPEPPVVIALKPAAYVAPS